MRPTLEVLFTPAEFAALKGRDLSETTCVVFDVLRFTSTIVTALANGAAAIVPVTDIADALALKLAQPAVLLGGERNGVRIGANLTGGIEFNLGNSPREYGADIVAGKTIVMTTTNGTRAFQACANAQAVYACSFLNVAATARRLLSKPAQQLLIVCSGTFDQAALEDAVAAGALCDLVWQYYERGQIADSAQIARTLWSCFRGDLSQLAGLSSNARRLLGVPELRDDVAFCLRMNVYELVARLGNHQTVLREA